MGSPGFFAVWLLVVGCGVGPTPAGGEGYVLRSSSSAQADLALCPDPEAADPACPSGPRQFS